VCPATSSARRVVREMSREGARNRHASPCAGHAHARWFLSRHALCPGLQGTLGWLNRLQIRGVTLDQGMLSSCDCCVCTTPCPPAFYLLLREVGRHVLSPPGSLRFLAAAHAQARCPASQAWALPTFPHLISPVVVGHEPKRPSRGQEPISGSPAGRCILTT
jgi:hypothetical protein